MTGDRGHEKDDGPLTMDDGRGPGTGDGGREEDGVSGREGEGEILPQIEVEDADFVLASGGACRAGGGGGRSFWPGFGY